MVEPIHNTLTLIHMSIYLVVVVISQHQLRLQHSDAQYPLLPQVESAITPHFKRKESTIVSFQQLFNRTSFDSQKAFHSLKCPP
eukprot:Awhi_evm1s5535